MECGSIRRQFLVSLLKRDDLVSSGGDLGKSAAKVISPRTRPGPVHQGEQARAIPIRGTQDIEVVKGGGIDKRDLGNRGLPRREFSAVWSSPAMRCPARVSESPLADVTTDWGPAAVNLSGPTAGTPKPSVLAGTLS